MRTSFGTRRLTSDTRKLEPTRTKKVAIPMTTEFATELVTASVGQRPSNWMSTGFSRQNPLRRSSRAGGAFRPVGGPPPPCMWAWDTMPFIGSPRTAGPQPREFRRSVQPCSSFALRGVGFHGRPEPLERVVDDADDGPGGDRRARDH